MSRRTPIFAAACFCLLASSGRVVWAFGDEAKPPTGGDSGRAGGPAKQSITAEACVHDAALRLDQFQSLSARVRCKAEIFGQRIIGNGEYRQGSADAHLLRWDNKLQIGGEVATVQYVADGQYLWVHQNRRGKSTLDRVDISPVLAAEETFPRAADGQLVFGSGLGAIGGLPRLMRSLDTSVDFSELSENKVPARTAKGTVEVPVLLATGTWSATAWSRILPEQAAEIKAGAPPNLRRLSEHVPDRIVLTLAREDLFPYRIEYLRTSGDMRKPLMVIEFYEVQRNVKLDPQLFSYTPGSIPFGEATAQFIGNLPTP